MPAAICIIAKVMMKDGMPITVTPKAVMQPSRKAEMSANRMANRPGKGRFARFT